MNIYDLQQGLKTFHSIAAVLNCSQSNNYPIAPVSAIDRAETQSEAELIYNQIKDSCMNLLKLMTDGEIDRLDIASVVTMFGESFKAEIINLIKTNEGEKNVKWTNN